MQQITELYRKMEERLDAVDLESEDVVQIAKRSYKVAEATMSELKDLIIHHQFASKEEEIEFFKVIKPDFYSKLIYFIRLFEIESGYRTGSAKERRRYLRRKLNNLNFYFKENVDFCRYLRTGATHLDELYFTRNKFDLNLGLDLNYFDCDPGFSTSHDYKVAMLMANEALANYIQQAIEQQPSRKGPPILSDLRIGWAETKAGLVELLYALHSANVFCSLQTNTPVELKQVANLMETVLGISLGNYSRTFQEIRIRKKGRTAFLDKIRERLIQRMDDADE